MKHKKSFLYRFLVRWLVCSVGLWIAAAVLSERITYGGRLGAIVMGGLVLAAINTLVKPLIVFLSLPAILVTLGLFMLVINAITVLIAAELYGPLEVSGFWAAALAGVIIGLVNYLVTTVLEDRG